METLLEIVVDLTCIVLWICMSKNLKHPSIGEMLCFGLSVLGIINIAILVLSEDYRGTGASAIWAIIFTATIGIIFAISKLIQINKNGKS